MQFDPVNPALAYHVVAGNLAQSTDGGNTWHATGYPTSASASFPFVIDSVNDSRILAGGGAGAGSLMVSLDGGATFAPLNSPLAAVTAIGAATYQGTFNADASFPSVPDRGANSYDPNTIYITDGAKLFVTKDGGNTWVNRTRTGGFGGTVQAIAVDASNRDTAYLVIKNFTGGTGHVWLTTNGGRTWADISGTGGGALPDLPVYALALDPRHGPGAAGDVYVGTDNGVYQLPGGSTAWSRFGAGLPDAQVTSLQLSQATDTLTAGTYGRGMFQLFLASIPPADAAIVPGSPPPPVYGALRAVSGSSIWTGPVILAGDTVINASGAQALQNGLAPAQLNIIGVIQDPAGAPTFGKLTKIGQGSVTLAGSNSYAGVTEINQGVLIAENPNALGHAGPASSWTRPRIPLSMPEACPGSGIGPGPGNGPSKRQRHPVQRPQHRRPGKHQQQQHLYRHRRPRFQYDHWREFEQLPQHRHQRRAPRNRHDCRWTRGRLYPDQGTHGHVDSLRRQHLYRHDLCQPGDSAGSKRPGGWAGPPTAPPWLDGAATAIANAHDRQTERRPARRGDRRKPLALRDRYCRRRRLC